jgi:hypothetical protein
MLVAKFLSTNEYILNIDRMQHDFNLSCRLKSLDESVISRPGTDAHGIGNPGQYRQPAA